MIFNQKLCKGPFAAAASSLENTSTGCPKKMLPCWLIFCNMGAFFLGHPVVNSGYCRKNWFIFPKILTLTQRMQFQYFSILHVSIIIIYHFPMKSTQKLFKDNWINIFAKLIQHKPISSWCFAADIVDFISWDKSCSCLQECFSHTRCQNNSQSVHKLEKKIGCVSFLFPIITHMNSCH